MITGAALGGSLTTSSSASVTVIVNVASTAAFTPSSARIVTVCAWAVALDDTVPCTWPFAYDKPDGSPLTDTVTVSPSASDTAIANAAIVSPCSYVLSPGEVITGVAFGGSLTTSSSASVTVIVNVASTAAFTPSSARIVTVCAWAVAFDDTVPCTWPFACDRPDGSPLTVTATVSPSASDTAIANAAIVSPCSYVLSPGEVITGAAFGGVAAVTVIVNVAVTAVFTSSSAWIVAVCACAAALDDTAPWTWPLAYDRPDGSPLTDTVTVSPSASDTVIANGVMVSPCS